MKKLSLLLWVLLMFSCKKEEKPSYAVISGTVENNTGETAFVRGHDFELRMPITESGTFSDTLHITNDGFYELYVGRERTGIYLEKGANLTIKLDANQFDETISYSGKGAAENNFLAAKYLWNEQNVDFENLYTSDEKTFINKLDQTDKKLDSLYGASNISNENFQRTLSEEDKYARAALIENYQDAHRYYTGEDGYKVSSDFYKPIKDINYTDTLAFRNSAAYQNLLETHFTRLVNEETYTAGINNQAVLYLKKVDETLPDGYAKDKLMSSYLQFGLKPDASLDEAFGIYKNSNPNSENLAKLTERYSKLKLITEGNPSPTFDFENHKGGTTSLESLKGKYVYVDVWATWCGPCLREIPSLKEVEKDYSTKNIVFVSISIDEKKDYDKWKSMVTEKNLGGVQLMADNNWKTKFVEDYAIMGIPRFILIDPQGNIVSADAPRPSDPALRKMFDELI